MYNLGNFQGKLNPWKISRATYCAYNAISRVDVRVTVRVPGGVECQVIDIRGDSHPIPNESIWSETFVSSVLRSILDKSDEPIDNDGSPLLGLRKMDPLPTISTERRFLECATSEFFKGWQIGAGSLQHTPTVVSNYLADGLVYYFRSCCRLQEAVIFFRDIYKQDSSTASILAKVLVDSDMEIEAVQVMFDASKAGNVSYELLITQSQFLAGKKHFEKALKLAKLAAAHSPSEYRPWANLANLYIQVEDYESVAFS